MTGRAKRSTLKERASARMREQKPGGASDKAGGQGDRSSYSRDQRSGGGTPPQFIATVHQIKCLPLGVRKMTSRSAMRNHLRGSRRELQGRSPPVGSYEAPHGRLLG